jgi:hypothetical protein
LVVTEQTGSTFLGGTADKPEYGALVRIKGPDGTVFFVSVEGRAFASSCGQLEEVLDTDAERYDINGVDAAMVGATLCFHIDDDINVGVATGALDSDFDPQTFVGVARALQFVEVDRMPNTQVESSPLVAVTDPEFAGTLGGAEWSAALSGRRR